MTYQHFNAKERHTLIFLLQWNLSFRKIGRHLKKHHTMISREEKRNSLVAGNYCGGLLKKRLMNDERNHEIYVIILMNS